jgi:hypothetical protein
LPRDGAGRALQMETQTGIAYHPCRRIGRFEGRFGV